MKITKCTGEGQGSCKRCSDKGKWNRMWCCFLYKIEGYEGCYCSDCVKEITAEVRNESNKIQICKQEFAEAGVHDGRRMFFSVGVQRWSRVYQLLAAHMERENQGFAVRESLALRSQRTDSTSCLACKLENENRYAGGIYARKCQIIRKGLKNNPKRHLENNTNRIEK